MINMHPVLSVQQLSRMDLLHSGLAICFPSLPSMGDFKLNSFIHTRIHSCIPNWLLASVVGISG